MYNPDGWMDGWMDRWEDGWINEWIDGAGRMNMIGRFYNVNKLWVGLAPPAL